MKFLQIKLKSGDILVYKLISNKKEKKNLKSQMNFGRFYALDRKIFTNMTRLQCATLKYDPTYLLLDDPDALFALQSPR